MATTTLLCRPYLDQSSDLIVHLAYEDRNCRELNAADGIANFS